MKQQDFGYQAAVFAGLHASVFIQSSHSVNSPFSFLGPVFFLWWHVIQI